MSHQELEVDPSLISARPNRPRERTKSEGGDDVVAEGGEAKPARWYGRRQPSMRARL
jgi:hypothetical protein